MTSILLGQEWSISAKGLNLITENNSITNKNAVIQNALNSDLKEIGQPVLNKELCKTRIAELVLQIQKIRNVSAPKANEDSQAAPRLLKLTLTDGEGYVQAVESSQIPSISREKTPPGSKLLLKDVEVINGFLILNQENTKLLGGKVQHLFEKWELAKSIQHCNRTQATLDGPPAWVNFGHKISQLKEEILPPSKTKEQIKETSEFETQRQEAIAEASTGAIKKVFGGGVKQPVQNNFRNDNSRGKNDGGKNFGKNKRDSKVVKEKEIDDRPQKISDKVSLFDFLEDKLNIPENTESAKSKDEMNYRNFSDRSVDNRRNFDNSKGYNSHKNYNNYENNYDSSKSKFNKDSNVKRREINKSSEQFNSSSKYDSTRESNKNPSVYNKRENNKYENFNSAKFDLQKSSTFNDTFGSNRNNENYGNKHNQHYKKWESNKGQELPNSTKSFETAQNHSQMNGTRESSFRRTEKERISDSWHYRAPEKGDKSLTHNTNSQVDGLADSMSKVSMNHEFASRTLRSHLNLDTKKHTQVVQQPPKSETKNLSVGEGCLAKYWEDGKFYPAKITGSTEATYVVQFEGYGNIEEVLKVDCKTSGFQEKGHYKGSMEFRRSPRKFAAS